MSFPEPVPRTEKMESRKIRGGIDFIKHKGQGVNTKYPWQKKTQQE